MFICIHECFNQASLVAVLYLLCTLECTDQAFQLAVFVMRINYVVVLGVLCKEK